MKKRDIVGLSIFTAILLIGCVQKTTQFKAYNEVQNTKVSLPISNKACVGDNCTAKIAKTDKCPNSVKPFAILAKAETEKIESVYDDSDYSISIVEDEPYLSLNLVDSFPQIDIDLKKVSIQVGAFRKYSGAEIYKRRYSMLSNQYKAVIKNGLKDSKPIFRVQIEGFESELEANRFISEHKHSLGGAFLVRI